MKNPVFTGIISLLSVWLIINTVQISQLRADLEASSVEKPRSKKGKTVRERSGAQERSSVSEGRGKNQTTRLRRQAAENTQDNFEPANAESGDTPEEDERIRKLVAAETKREMNQRTERWQEMARQRMTERVNEFSTEMGLNDDDSAALNDVVSGYMEDRMSSYWSVMEGDITREQAKEEMAAIKAETQDLVIDIVGEEGLDDLSEKLGHRADLGKE